MFDAELVLKTPILDGGDEMEEEEGFDPFGEEEEGGATPGVTRRPPGEVGLPDEEEDPWADPTGATEE